LELYPYVYSCCPLPLKEYQITCISIALYIHTYIHIHLYIHHTCIYIHIFIHICIIYMYINIYKRKNLGTLSIRLFILSSSLETILNNNYSYAFITFHLPIYMHPYVYSYTHLVISIYTYIYKYNIIKEAQTLELCPSVYSYYLLPLKLSQIATFHTFLLRCNLYFLLLHIMLYHPISLSPICKCVLDT
jgi:hypothetical protein